MFTCSTVRPRVLERMWRPGRSHWAWAQPPDRPLCSVGDCPCDTGAPRLSQAEAGGKPDWKQTGSVSLSGPNPDMVLPEAWVFALWCRIGGGEWCALHLLGPTLELARLRGPRGADADVARLSQDGPGGEVSLIVLEASICLWSWPACLSEIVPDSRSVEKHLSRRLHVCWHKTQVFEAETSGSRERRSSLAGCLGCRVWLEVGGLLHAL